MKIANVWSQTSVILHKKEKPKYLGSNVNTIPTAPCYFVYYVIHPACTDRTATKTSPPVSVISGVTPPVPMIGVLVGGRDGLVIFERK
jgi:hypothetical protein